MLIYRVAHETERDGADFPTGPYTSGATLTDDQADALWNMSLAHSRATHPAPQADPRLGHMDATERCGFDSLDALYAWFDGYIPTLADCGFRVWVYEVPDSVARVGKRGQAVFDRHDAREIRNEPLAVQFEIGAPCGADSAA